jgi:glutaredoxin
MGVNDRSREMRLTLYTKPDCELCHEAKATLRTLSRELTFDLVEIDITTDAALYNTFREEIPVGFLDGQKLFKYRVDPSLLRRQFRRRRVWLSGRWLFSL